MKFLRYELEVCSTLSYISEKLMGVNTLSDCCLEIINNKKGAFFTLLPADVDQKEIYKFRIGGLAAGVREATREMLLKKLRVNERLSCVFDDVSSEYKEGYKHELYDSNGIHFRSEVYYVVSCADLSFEKLADCFYVSEAVWHSLCVISESKCNIGKEISKDKLREISAKADLILVGAYDAEGYVFWEPNKHNRIIFFD